MIPFTPAFCRPDIDSSSGSAHQTTGYKCDGPGPAVTCASRNADLLAAGERVIRLTGHVRQLETRLANVRASRAARVRARRTADIGALNQKINLLEQQAVAVRLQLAACDQHLPANRELSA